MQIQNLYFHGSFFLVNQWRSCSTAVEHTDTIQLFIWQLLSHQDHLLPGPSMFHICISCYPREQWKIKTGKQNKTTGYLIYCTIVLGLRRSHRNGFQISCVSLNSFYPKLVQAMGEQSSAFPKSLKNYFICIWACSRYPGLFGPHISFSCHCRHHII